MPHSRVVSVYCRALLLLAAVPGIALSQRALGVSIADITMQEGNGGFAAFLFTVTVVRDTAQPAQQVTMGT